MIYSFLLNSLNFLYVFSVIFALFLMLVVKVGIWRCDGGAYDRSMTAIYGVDGVASLEHL